MSSDRRKILVTSALPYANGSIHLGHLVEYIQTDVWVRFQKHRGHECYYVCATDAHGTPTMLAARREGIEPAKLVERMQREHEKDLAAFLVEFDNFHATNSDENRHYVYDIYERLKNAGHIYTETVNQAFDAAENMFLPDRFVRGTCPHCATPDQYGDACENCGQTYTPKDLIDPRSVLSGDEPVYRDSEHYFFRLSAFAEFLVAWMDRAGLDASVRRKLEEWFDQGLTDWDISRDEPYFGFRIPETDNKYFYVWLDAPVGYIASFAVLCRRLDLDIRQWWQAGSDTELYHFIGKDIMYFHALFWPAVLEGAGYRVPTSVYAHGFLTVNGQKMSKSRGTFINARSYLDHLRPACLRYYYAAKLGPGIDDIDLNLDDFVARVNSDLVGKYANLASRNAGFITKRFEGRLADTLHDTGLYGEFVDAGETIAGHYERREFGHAVRLVMSLADRANQYVDSHKPWAMARDESTLPEVQEIATQSLNLFRILTIYLAPVVPDIAAAAGTFLNSPDDNWDARETPLLGSTIRPYEALVTRIDAKAVEALVEDSREPG